MRKDNAIESLKFGYSVWTEEQDLRNFVDSNNLLIMNISPIKDDPNNPGYKIYQEIWKFKDDKDWLVSYNSYREDWVDKINED